MGGVERDAGEWQLVVVSFFTDAGDATGIVGVGGLFLGARAISLVLSLFIGSERFRGPGGVERGRAGDGAGWIGFS